MANLHIDACERVAANLRVQASAHTQIAALHLIGKVTDENRRHASEHTETARLFTLLHADIINGRLADLDVAAALATPDDDNAVALRTAVHNLNAVTTPGATP